MMAGRIDSAPFRGATFSNPPSCGMAQLPRVMAKLLVGVAIASLLLPSVQRFSTDVAHAQSSCSLDPYFAGAASGAGPSYVIEGCVWHIGGCSVEYGTMTLRPLDRTAQVAQSYFCFEGIPPGEYELTFFPPCNPAGCTGVEYVTVLDEDVFVLVGRSNCPGDCTADRRVTVDEVVRCVRRALGEGPGCGLCDSGGEFGVGIDDLVTVVGALLHGC